MKQQNQRNGLLSLFVTLLVAIIVVAGLMYFLDITPYDVDRFLTGIFTGETTDAAQGSVGSTLPKDGLLSVTVIDCGNADSIFVRTAGGKTMLIDAGESDDFEKIDEFLQSAGVEKIDVLVATHPHNDHIGSMANVVKSYDIGEMYLPRVTHDTKTYEKMAKAVLEKGVTVHAAKGGAGATIDLGSDVTLTILAPLSDEYSDLNDYSIVLRLEYGDTVFLFTGDIESKAEKELLSAYPELLACDVLKVPHHGSDTSTSEAFLAAAHPTYAAITCEYASDYGHPSEEVTDRLTEHGVTYYRCDENGNIAFYSDGSQIQVVTEK